MHGINKINTKKIQVLNTQEIRVVTKIHEYNSIVLAAKALGTKPNYVNVTLIRLEEKLGCLLFARRQKTGTLEITQKGKVLVPKLIQISEIHLWILEYTNKNK